MKATDKEIVLNTISDLELTKDTQKMIANRYNVSESLVEKINRCKVYSELHSYNNNIRRESNNLSIGVVNAYSDYDDYYVLTIMRTDNQQIETKISCEDYDEISKYIIKAKPDDSMAIGVIKGTEFMQNQLPQEINNKSPLWENGRAVDQQGIPLLLNYHSFREYPHIGLFGSSGVSLSPGINTSSGFFSTAASI